MFRRPGTLLLLASLALSSPAAYPAAPHSAAAPRAPGVAAPGAHCPTDAESAKRSISATALRFFLENTSPETGLVRDTASNFGPTVSPESSRRASIAATGFGLATVATAARGGEVSRAFAEHYCERALRFAVDHQKAMTRNGWFLHFIDWRDGSRWGNSEYSTIDTALFLAGAITCRETFPTPEMRRLADMLYGAVDFVDMMTDGGKKPGKRTLSLSYRLEPTGKHAAGYSPYQWDHYAEHALLLLLGLGSPSAAHRLPPDAWTAWARERRTIGAEAPSLQGKSLVGFDRALFTHQYPQLFVDLEGKRDASGMDFFENAKLATEYDRALCRAETGSTTFGQGFYGLSAGDAPPPPGSDPESTRYEVNTPTRPLPRAGTACLGCVPGSAEFSPEVLSDVAAWCKGPYASRIWGRYGLADSINLDKSPEGWVSPKVHAITIGPEYLSIANLDRGRSVWSVFMRNPDVRRGLAAAFGQE